MHLWFVCTLYTGLYLAGMHDPIIANVMIVVGLHAYDAMDMPLSNQMKPHLHSPDKTTD